MNIEALISKAAGDAVKALYGMKESECLLMFVNYQLFHTR